MRTLNVASVLMASWNNCIDSFILPDFKVSFPCKKNSSAWWRTGLNPLFFKGGFVGSHTNFHLKKYTYMQACNMYFYGLAYQLILFCRFCRKCFTGMRTGPIFLIHDEAIIELISGTIFMTNNNKLPSKFEINSCFPEHHQFFHHSQFHKQQYLTTNKAGRYCCKTHNNRYTKRSYFTHCRK